MNGIPDLLLERVLRRGWHAMRANPAHVYEVLPNLPREDAEQVLAFVRESILDIRVGPPSTPPALPSAVILLKGEQESQAYLGGQLDFDPPEEMTWDDPDSPLVRGVASTTGTAGMGREVVPVTRVASAGSNWLEVAADSWGAHSLENRSLVLRVRGGKGAGQIRALVSNGARRIYVGAWDAGKAPDDTSWFDVRETAADVIGEPVRQFDRAGRWERIGSRFTHTLDIECAAINARMTVYLGYLLKGLLTRNLLELTRRGLEDVKVSAGDLQRKPDYFPDAALVRTLSVTCESEFSVVQPIDSPDTFTMRVWAAGDNEDPEYTLAGSFAPPTT